MTHSMQTQHKEETGLIAWFANNSVAANLLMFFIIIMGLISYFTIPRQMFPNVEINYIHIDVAYPGASPQEIEQSILIKIEESLKGITEIKESITESNRGSGRIMLEVDPGASVPEVLDKVKLKADGIATFPAAMEPLTVYQVEFRQDVVELALAGNYELSELKPIAKQIEDELLHLDNISLVDLSSPKDEISIEIQPEILRQYNLTIADVSRAIRLYSANISAGQVKTDAGIISVRVENQFYSGDEFREIPVKVSASGAKVLLQDIATIKDEFVEGERYFKYSGENALLLAVKATSEQSIVPVAQSVKSYIEQKNKTLPQGMQMKVLVDFTYYLDERLNMMLTNLFQGAILVALMLAVFLRIKLALWVMIGLPVCFLGVIMMMPVMGVTINVLSLFAFIMVLGIVVDDAIVIGESASTEIENHGGGVQSVVRGAKRVATPATFGVLTTIAVFAPSLFSSGPERAIFYSIAMVVILCLVFSLIESKLILPAHLAHTKFTPIKEGGWRDRFNRSFFGFVNGSYKRFVTKCVEWRWSVLSAFVGFLIVSFALVSANYVRVVMEAKVPHDFPTIQIEMNDTASDKQTIAALKSIEAVVLNIEKETEAEFGQGMMKDMLSFNQGRTNARMVIPLVDEALRPYDTFELARRWRAAMPTIPGMKSITIHDSLGGGGSDGEFGYLLYGSDIDTLTSAGRALIGKLQQEKGLYDISSTIDPASIEVQMVMKPVAYNLGLNLSDIASQVGNSFYGGEAQRVLRNGEEIRVMVKYPRLTREAFSSLKYTVITAPNGKEVMLGDVVELTEKPGVSFIRRQEGYRTVYVWGAIDEELVEPNEIIEKVDDELLPQLLTEFPSVKTKLGGNIEEQQAQTNEQMLFFIAGMIIVYMLLAIPLKSYGQPALIMSVIPFGFAGAIWGHLLFGIDLSMMSIFGLIAAAGVVINDSLVMTDYVNQRRRAGVATCDAVVEAGCARFRAIFLTSITTFVGILPIMFETSLQAKMVVPMAVSLGFAVLFTTLITLILVPCLYLIMEDMSLPFKKLRQKVFGKSGTDSSTSIV
ncbi:efflux RND transporter permease subunit (plasmid) [Pseudoalteromonas sp. T1lg65]|uniref:efflux RND transporter permease subunit n=1 Tax=Pseudoalteromonas sp. T1lg65 TaxID=2077101 RepID=UPI003F7A9660